MVESEYDDKNLPESAGFISGPFLDRFVTALLMAQGRRVAEDARRVSTFGDRTGTLRRSITPIPIRDNKGIKVTTRHRGRYLPYASPLGVRSERIPDSPLLDIRGPFTRVFGEGTSGKGFSAVESRMVERLQELLTE